MIQVEETHPTALVSSPIESLNKQRVNRQGAKGPLHRAYASILCLFTKFPSI